MIIVHLIKMIVIMQFLLSLEMFKIMGCELKHNWMGGMQDSMN